MREQHPPRKSFCLPKPFYITIALLVLASWGEAADFGKVTTSKVADGLYLFTTARYGDVGFGGNAVAMLTDDGIVMFDTSGTPASAQAILAELRKLTDKPVLYVINSHWHWATGAATRYSRRPTPTCSFCRLKRIAI